LFLSTVVSVHSFCPQLCLSTVVSVHSCVCPQFYFPNALKCRSF
jgi:hypothetical protein